MNEKKMRRKLRILLAFSCCITIFIFVAGFVGTRVFMTTVDQTTKESMESEAQNYKRRIRRQIDNNFQMLNTLASFIESSKMIENPDFVEGLVKADAQNDFLVFGYFDLEGKGVFSKIRNQEQVRLSNMSEEIQAVVKHNYEGEEAVSDAFIGEVSSQTVLVYGVPVYQDGQIIGSLVASDSVDAFSEKLGNKKLISSKGYMHLVDSEGSYLIRGNESAVKENLATIVEPPYMSEKEGARVKTHLKAEDRYEFDFLYENKEYNALLEPLGINGWYLFCVNSAKNVNHGIYGIVKVTVTCFAIVAVLFGVILSLGYREIKGNNKKLRNIAYYDELTKIHNFRYFKEYCEEVEKERDEYAIVALNVKQFKFINEIFGNHQADQLLCYIAHILQDSILEGECACRESADYFYLFLQETDVCILQERIRTLMDCITKSEEVERSGYHLVLHCGVAISEEGKEFQDIMTYAMFAMAKAKETPQKDLWFFDTALHEQEQLNNYIENNAHEALKNGEFALYLQPKIDFEDDSLCGAEALVRWEERNGKIVYPGAFIPLFEENGFCVELDMYMFEKVCKKLRSWMDEGVTPINISINQSRLTFYKENYVEDLCKILKKYNVPASWITLEILEGMFLKDVDEMTIRLKKLKEIGFRISMDDFGTGYSSLNILGKLKIDELKLDRGFLNEALEDENQNTKLIMEEIIQLSHKLSVSIVIEGIETAQQDQFVKQIGCEYGQGFFYGRPTRENIFTKNFIQKV